MFFSLYAIRTRTICLSFFCFSTLFIASFCAHRLNAYARVYMHINSSLDHYHRMSSEKIDRERGWEREKKRRKNGVVNGYWHDSFIFIFWTTVSRPLSILDWIEDVLLWAKPKGNRCCSSPLDQCDWVQSDYWWIPVLCLWRWGCPSERRWYSFGANHSFPRNTIYRDEIRKCLRKFVDVSPSRSIENLLAFLYRSIPTAFCPLCFQSLISFLKSRWPATVDTQSSLPSGPTLIRHSKMAPSPTSTMPLHGHFDVSFVVVIHRYTKEEQLLKQGKDWVQQGFPQSTAFKPNSILICTWKDVHAFYDQGDKVRMGFDGRSIVPVDILGQYLSSCLGHRWCSNLFDILVRQITIRLCA